jgi:hypothetical protein
LQQPPKQQLPWGTATDEIFSSYVSYCQNFHISSRHDCRLINKIQPQNRKLVKPHNAC